MEIIDSSAPKSKNNRTLLIILAIVGAFLCLCIVVIGVVVVSLISMRGSPITSRDVTPPHYGVFVNQDGELLELQEREIFDLPVEDEVADAQVVTDAKPKIIVWRSDTRLDYLTLYKLGQFLHEQEEINYTATPKEDGMIELTPSSPLRDGAYCLVQGDPMGMFLPGWCFKTEP